MSVRPSVRLSVCHIPVLYQNGLTCIILSSVYGSPIILVFPVLNIFLRNSNSVPYWSVEYRWCIYISRFSVSRPHTWVSQMFHPREKLSHPEISCSVRHHWFLVCFLDREKLPQKIYGCYFVCAADARSVSNS